jgi:hypothetical protein
MVRMLAGAVCLVISVPARADFPPITDRNYAIDLYDGVALGNTATVGMGGAAVALAMGSSGTVVNPAAPAVKSTTDNDWWGWDYHIDYLTSLSRDYDNNGVVPTCKSATGADESCDNGGPSVITAGLSLRINEWAGAVTVVGQTATNRESVMLPSGQMAALDATALRTKLTLARAVPEIDAVFGLAIVGAAFSLTPDCTGPGCQSLFQISGAGLEGGATWIPQKESFRLAAAASTPITGGDVTHSDACPDLANCEGYILPSELKVPWRVVVGGAYRFAPTAWNVQIGGNYPYRDEKATTVAVDLVTTGATSNGYGLEEFTFHQLQRSGRHIAVSLRGGVEYEWLPGRLRLRAGSYWEPERFDDVGGRLHGTFGAELRVFEFYLWGYRRGKLGLTADLATRYRNVGLSIGLWH